jgi:hypothetical protein
MPQDNQLMSHQSVLSFSRNFDLNGEARTARTKQSSPIVPLRRFHHVINSDEVFGTHRADHPFSIPGNCPVTSLYGVSAAVHPLAERF